MNSSAERMRASKEESSANTGWLQRPLCVKYVFVEFQRLLLPIHEPRSIRRHDWMWAFGLIGRSDYEVLGAWPSGLSREEVAEDLRRRGVKQLVSIRVAAGIECAEDFPKVAACSSEPTFGARRLAAIQSASNIARRLQSSLVRAIDRRPPFTSECIAQAFLARRLESADRRLEDVLPALKRRQPPTSSTASVCRA
jgi:hypothetical protein